MNPTISVYFDHLEQHLLESDAVTRYTLVRHEVTPTDGKIRVRAQLKDEGLLELFEYVALDNRGDTIRLKYAYHWQDANGLLVRRWDAVPHHLELPYAPHHVHLPDGSVEGIVAPPGIAEVLNQIEATMRQRQET